MLSAFLVLMVCQFLGEGLQLAFRLPVPGPVIGMFLLAAVLIGSQKSTVIAPLRDCLMSLSNRLISWMGLFFVPAGAGLIAESGLLRREWLPIVAAVAGSTVLSILSTGLVLQFFLRPKPFPAMPQIRHEVRRARP